MPGPLPVTDSLVIPESDLSVRFSRASGPGGQGVNTTDSRVELSLDLAHTGALTEEQRDRALARLAGRLVNGVLTVSASEYRSQLRNRQAAEERVQDLLRDAVAPPPPPRKRTKPSRRAKQRRLDAKKRRSQVKHLRRGGWAD
ncbi:aminoacyl-tRNA hydrolase [Spiractinospora alimapuensis]|uniref:alternative ribosome rescue aminoacyl-tRNA hydrolase ArfB n=1 Tax=Spiractinospora alimapuensis TaxID=2820884 RepID=UPI001EECF247|nr:alternative ribosome rescue aminoacyl-tRNA hydrolase ArfB [Spiractinospora alimapuensis]QVQ52616.1 aminoacyl-tRNA hydrolase [Spiractinospora alimapuensis]